MKLISIFYFINFSLVIAANSGFGALNVALTGIQIRDFPMILSRGAREGLTSLPHLEDETQKRSQSSQASEINLSSTDSRNDTQVQFLFFSPVKEERTKDLAFF